MNTTALRLIAAAVALTVAGTAHADIIGTNAGFTFSGSPTVGSFDFSIDATGFENLSLSFDFNAIETEVCDGTFPADCQSDRGRSFPPSAVPRPWPAGPWSGRRIPVRG